VADGKSDTFAANGCLVETDSRGHSGVVGRADRAGQWTGVLAMLITVVTAARSGNILFAMIAGVAAFLRGNLDDAFAVLDQHRECATLFKESVRFYTGEEIAVLLSQAGCAVDGHYGIRCLCDYWGDNERKSDPDTFAQIKKLELALTDRHPYNLLARYFQVVAHKL
jgi:S-adenosylmethionine-dependent methyltransferase